MRVIAAHLFKPIDKAAGPSWVSIRRETLRFAGVAALNQIHSVIASQTSRVVVGAASGVAAAAYYQVPAMLASRVNSMLGRVAYVIFPTASGMYARNDAEGVKTLYLRTSRLFFAVNGSVTMAMCALAYPLLEYWVSPKYAQEGAVALAIFSLTSAMNATTMSASYVNLSAARPGVESRLRVLEQRDHSRQRLSAHRALGRGRSRAGGTARGGERAGVLLVRA